MADDDFAKRIDRTIQKRLDESVAMANDKDSALQASIEAQSAAKKEVRKIIQELFRPRLIAFTEVFRNRGFAEGPKDEECEEGDRILAGRWVRYRGEQSGFVITTTSRIIPNPENILPPQIRMCVTCRCASLRGENWSEGRRLYETPIENVRQFTSGGFDEPALTGWYQRELEECARQIPLPK